MKMYAVKETKVGEFINATIESEHGSAMIIMNDLDGLEMCLINFESRYVFAKMLHTMDNQIDIEDWLRENLVDRKTYTFGDNEVSEWAERSEALQFATSIMAYLCQSDD